MHDDLPSLFTNKRRARKKDMLFKLSRLESVDQFYLDILLDAKNEIITKMKKRIEKNYKIKLKKNWNLKELKDIEAALERFKYLLGDTRKSNLGEQELAQVIRTAQGDDTTTAGHDTWG